MKEERYPGYSTLTESAFLRDKEVVSGLTMELVNVLVSIYNPQTANTKKTPSTSSSSPAPEENSPTPFQLPQPGGADLLLP